MAVLVGSARIDENGNATGGVAGDQTGKEVSTQNWYLHSKGWVLLRPNSAYAEKIASTMEAACANNNIGYDQSQRNTLYSLAKAVDWDVSKVSACETDCSALVRVCCAAAGITLSDFNTSTEASVLVASGKFTKYTEDKYCTASTYLKRGDILVTKSKGHTVVVLGNGSGVTTSTTTTSTGKITASQAAKSKDSSLSGTYKVTASSLNVRDGAGTSNKVLVTIPKGTAVKNYGYYTEVSGTKWLYIQFSLSGVTYTGFASGKYLSK